MNARFYRRAAAPRPRTAAALFLLCFTGCAQVLGVKQWQDPAGTGGGGSTPDQDAGTDGAGGAKDPTCADGIKNGLETDIDCGGDSCPPCPLGKACANNADCSTKSCVAGACVTPPHPAPCSETDAGATCNDCLKDGTETDVDCGGDSCDPCPAGKGCASDADCLSGKCALEPAPATCSP